MPESLRQLLIDSLALEPNACEGKLALITGAGRGIGLEIARAFCILGGRVALAELDETSGKQAEAELRSAGCEALFVKTDVSLARDVQRLQETVSARLGTPDLLINNAIRCPVVSVLEMDEAAWDAVLAVNLKGAFLTCRAFVPAMLARRQGIVINMVSGEAMPGLAAYMASKQGLAAFSQTLALEVNDSGVYIVPFAPGMVDTPGIRGVAADLAPRLGMSREQFMGLSLHAAYDGMMPVTHAAAAALYLALRLAPETHGQMIDGYAVLERAGLLQTGFDTTADWLNNTAPTQSANLEQLLSQVTEIIRQSGQEFEKLPAFVRPLARRGFKSKSGQSIEDWLHTLAGSPFFAGSPTARQLAARLDGLCEYFRGVPAETARFSRDPELLRQMSKLSTERINTIQALKKALE